MGRPIYCRQRRRFFPARLPARLPAHLPVYLPVLRRGCRGFLLDLGNLDLPFWYDRGLYGGTEWDAVLEDRIRACSVLIAFVSPAAVASKYCRREIKFADTIDIPILGVMLEPTELRHGLAMLFQQYQTLSAGVADFPRQLVRAIGSLIPD